MLSQPELLGAATPEAPAGGRDPDVRDRIYASALRHFSRKGYAATSLREISEDAQTTKPMVYYYFGSKEGLYGNIVREILEEMAEAIRSHVPTGVSASEQVTAYCARYLDHFLAKEEIIALVLREVFGLGGMPMATFAQAMHERVLQPLDEILHRGMEQGEFHADHVGSCAAAITSIVNGFILAQVFGGRAIDREAALRQVGWYVRGLQRSSEG